MNANGAPKLADAPTLDELGAHPDRVHALPAELVSDYTFRTLTILAALNKRQSTAPLPVRQGSIAGDRLIGCEEAAEMIGMSVSWVEKHVRELPERVSVLGKPRWRKSDIEKWIKARPIYGSPS